MPVKNSLQDRLFNSSLILRVQNKLFYFGPNYINGAIRFDHVFNELLKMQILT